MLQVIQRNRVRDLVDLATVKRRLGVESDDDDLTLSGMIREATGKIEEGLERVFSRQRYRQRSPTFGDHDLVLETAPAEWLGQSALEVSNAGLLTVSLEDSVITDWDIGDAESGILYREAGFAWSAVRGGLLDAIQQPGSEEMSATVEFWAGYLMPGQGLRVAAGDFGGDPLESLFVTGAVAEGASSFAVGDDSVIGKVGKGFAFMVPGSTKIYTVQQDAEVASNAVSVSFSPALDVALADGDEVAFSPVYLPAVVSGEALEVVKELWVRRTVPSSVSSTKAGDFSTSFTPMEKVYKNTMSRLSAFRLGGV